MTEFKKISDSEKFIKGAIYFVIHGNDGFCELHRFFSFCTLNKNMERKCDSCIHSTSLVNEQKVIVTFFDANGNECDQYIELENSEELHMKNEVRIIAESYLDPSAKFNVVSIEVSPFLLTSSINFVVQMNDKLVTVFVKKYRGNLTKDDVMENIKEMQSSEYYNKYDLSKIKIDGIDIKESTKSCVLL